MERYSEPMSNKAQEVNDCIDENIPQGRILNFLSGA